MLAHGLNLSASQIKGNFPTRLSSWLGLMALVLLGSFPADVDSQLASLL